MHQVNNVIFDHTWGKLNELLSKAPAVDTGEWQAIRGAPQSKMIEVEDVSVVFWPPQRLEILQSQVKPNLPWAEDHFQERISSIPHNPPPSHVDWPFAQQGNQEHTDGEKFSHTYPERFWPKWAGDVYEEMQHSNSVAWEPHRGIRFDYGDLEDLIQMMVARPYTRQAYLPVWFPEDGWAAMYQERVPCTLGYHFMIREEGLKCVYYIRSCDLYRHFRDDLYMAARLQQYIAGELGVEVRQLVMHISSLHIFEQERIIAEHEASSDEEIQNRLLGMGF